MLRPSKNYRGVRMTDNDEHLYITRPVFIHYSRICKSYNIHSRYNIYEKANGVGTEVNIMFNIRDLNKRKAII